MRQQQLITKKDLYTRYTYTCSKCNETFTKTLDKYYTLHNSDWEKVQICKKCAFNLLKSQSSIYLLYDWEIYHYQSGVKYRFCPHCGRAIYDDWTSLYCADCSRRFYHWSDTLYYCTSCWMYHRKWICMKWVTNNYTLLDNADNSTYLNMHTSRDSKGRAAKWNAKEWKITELKKLPYQEERKLPLDILEDMEDFYSNNYCEEDWFFDNYFFWQPIEIDGTVEYKRYDWLKNFRKILTDIEMKWKQTSQWYKPSKYRNHFFQDISEDWLITWKYIDMYWGIREKKESINKFFKDNGVKSDNVSLSRKIYYRLSSNIHHKKISFDINHKLGSCQQPHNSESYAAWAYDAITNWCNCPILLYNSKEDMEKGKDPIGRITSRIMYDNDWQMYILIDRLYNDWSLSGQKIKWMMYKLIIEDIKSQWYKVIVSNYSAHDSSTLQYLEALWMKKWGVVTNLWQPLRRLFDVNCDEWVCWYYSDWWIEVYQEEINWLKRASDYLDKAFII